MQHVKPVALKTVRLPARPEIPARRPRLREKLGICQWFHFEDYQAVERTVELMKELGARHLRTGISWADAHRPGAKR